MSSRHPRFVTLCQQFLALGLVCAVLTPAATVLSLDLVPSPDRAGSSATGAGGVPAEMAAYVSANTKPVPVPTTPVEAVVTEYALTAPAGARIAPGALKAQAHAAGGGRTEVVSDPLPVTGYGAVGVTWAHGVELGDDAITVEARTYNEHDEKGGYEAGWSSWLPVEYHDDHGPDPTSAEGMAARPGTDELLIGDVDQVQVRITTDRTSPPDLKLAVVDPGRAEKTAEELPAIDTGELDGAAAPAVVTDPEPSAREEAGDGEDGLGLARAAFTPKPVIYSRAQWGANEKLRSGTPSYFEVHAGFVHHTVNANNYKAKDVPGILRSIYAYHTQSRGWSDVGYNYLVDRFGRIWEGRAGGVDRPVVGAHTLGYNENSFAMSAIGNFETGRPTQAMIEAYGALFGWKLSLHGVDAASTRQVVGSSTFQAINGHRDAGSTACPGKYLYAQLPRIRYLAKQAQVGFGGRQLESNIASTPHPDLLVRRKSDSRLFTIPVKKLKDGSYKTAKPIPSGLRLAGASKILTAGDWDRDGHVDLITRFASTGDLYLRRGTGDGKFSAVTKLATGFKQVGLLAAVGDVTGDGWPDLMGQPRGGDLRIYPGQGLDGLKPSYVAHSKVAATQQIPIGLWDADGAPDSLFRRGTTLGVMTGNGPGGLTGGMRSVKLDLAPYDWVVGISDVDLGGHPDLVLRQRSDKSLWLVRATATSLAAPVQIGADFADYDLVG